MIKLPKEVSQALKTLEAAGTEGYAAGACVRECLMGNEPLDWDIITPAPLETLKEIFPKADVLSKRESILRIDKTKDGNEEGIILDISTYRKPGFDGKVQFCGSVEEDLGGRDFTINAIADNPALSLKDPWQGRDDIKKKMVRTISDPKEAFEKEPALMLKAILLAAELDFDLPKTAHEAMMEKAGLLEKVPVSQRRELLSDIIIAEHAGKGLRMLAASDLMPGLVGDAALDMTRRQRELFGDLAEGIDQLKPVAERRLGLLYLCFEKKGPQAIEFLDYDEKTRQHLMDAMTEMTKIFFIRDKAELKNYIYKVGMERYNYVHNLAKAQRIVYPTGNVKVENRHYLMEEIMAGKEPIFIEDLAIDAQDILDEGITDSQERAAYLLELLPAVVHQKPQLNKKKELLKCARRFNKSKLSAAFRGVKWLR